MISVTAPRASKILMTVTRGAMIVVLSCTWSVTVVILSWLVASVAIQYVDIFNSGITSTVLTILTDYM